MEPTPAIPVTTSRQSDLFRRALFVVWLLASVAFPSVGRCQDVEPRFLVPAPVGTNFAALAYSFSSGAVLADKTVPIQNVDGDVHLVGPAIGRFFGFFGVTSRADIVIPVGTGTWYGDFEGRDTTTTRVGFADPMLRFTVFFAGAPALQRQEFVSYRHKTVGGATLRMRVPIGQYDSSKLINLGTNRWVFSPRIGVSHRAGRFLLEGYGSVWLFTDNNEFSGDNTLAQDPLVAFQAHVAYAFRPGLWVAFGTRQSFGGETSLNGSPSEPQTNNRIGVTVAVPIARRHGIRFAFTSGILTRTGNDYNTFATAWQHSWASGGPPVGAEAMNGSAHTMTITP